MILESPKIQAIIRASRSVSSHVPENGKRECFSGYKRELKGLAIIDQQHIFLREGIDFLNGVQTHVHEFGHLLHAQYPNLNDLLRSLSVTDDHIVRFSQEELFALAKHFNENVSIDIDIIISIGKKIIDLLVPQEKQIHYTISSCSEQRMFEILCDTADMNDDYQVKPQWQVQNKELKRRETAAMYFEMAATMIIEHTFKQMRWMSGNIVIENRMDDFAYQRARKLAFYLFLKNLRKN